MPAPPPIGDTDSARLLASTTEVEEALLVAWAEQAARAIVGVHGVTPLARDDSSTETGDDRLSVQAILGQRAALIASQKYKAPTELPDETHLLDRDGHIVPVSTDRLDARSLLAAQVVEAAGAVAVMGTLARIARRICALERLRELADDLDSIENGGEPS